MAARRLRFGRRFRCLGAASRPEVGQSSLSDLGQRYGDHKVRALPRPATVGVDRAVMRFYDVFDDCQTQPQPALRAFDGTVGLAEAVEDVWQEVWVNALPRV